MRPLQLLLIEDDTDSGDAMSLLLRAHGIHVDWASSGQQALDLYRRDRKRPVDIILLDLMLPDMDGASLIDELSRLIPLPPIVIHSAASENAIQENGNELRAIAVLRKPTDWSRLLGILESCRPAEVAPVL